MTCRSMVCIYSSVRVSFYCQGLTLECNCSQLPEAWLPAAETPHTGVRPWKQRYSLTEKEMLAIDLPGHLCDPTGARAGHRIDAGPASYPRGVLRGERPKRVLVSFARSKETPSGKRPRQAGKPVPRRIRRAVSRQRQQGGKVRNQQLPHLGIFVVHLHYDKTSNFMEPA